MCKVYSFYLWAIEHKDLIEIVASIITVIGFGVGIWQFRISARSQESSTELQEENVRSFKEFITNQNRAIIEERNRYLAQILPDLAIRSSGSKTQNERCTVVLNIVSHSNRAKNIRIITTTENWSFIESGGRETISKSIPILREDISVPFSLIHNKRTEPTEYVRNQYFYFKVEFSDMVGNRYTQIFHGSEHDGYRSLPAELIE